MKLICTFILLLFFTCSNNPQWQTLNTKNTPLKINFIRQIILEKDKLSWVGTFGDGLYKVRENKWVKVESPFIGKYILSLKKDSKGGIWIGTARYGAYYFYKDTWTHLDQETGLAGNNVWHMLLQKNGTIWFCSRYRGICRKKNDSLICMSIKQGLPDRQVTVAEEDRRGNVWIGTARGGLCCYSNDSLHSFHNRANGLSGNYIRALICDTTIKWVGSWDGGLDFYTGQTWEHIEGITKPVVFLGYDDHRNLWVGTWGHGVYYLNTDGWKHLTQENSGMPNNYVIDIKFAKNGKIYFATSGGVAIYSPKQ